MIRKGLEAGSFVFGAVGETAVLLRALAVSKEFTPPTLFFYSDFDTSDRDNRVRVNIPELGTELHTSMNLEQSEIIASQDHYILVVDQPYTNLFTGKIINILNGETTAVAINNPDFYVFDYVSLVLPAGAPPRIKLGVKEKDTSEMSSLIYDREDHYWQVDVDDLVVGDLTIAVDSTRYFILVENYVTGQQWRLKNPLSELRGQPMVSAEVYGDKLFLIISNFDLRSMPSQIYIADLSEAKPQLEHLSLPPGTEWHATVQNSPHFQFIARVIKNGQHQVWLYAFDGNKALVPVQQLPDAATSILAIDNTRMIGQQITFDGQLGFFQIDLEQKYSDRLQELALPEEIMFGLTDVERFQDNPEVSPVLHLIFLLMIMISVISVRARTHLRNS
ncbi:MAG TPA: hypothetical protein VD999_01690 [Vitreimonas sp.]|nr:hypothetical protein [Vitreimonas sp.]